MKWKRKILNQNIFNLNESVRNETHKIIYQVHIFRSTPVSPNTHNLYEYKWWSEKAKEIKFTVMLSPRTNRYRWTDFACVCVWVCDKTDDSIHTLSDWQKSVCLCVWGCMCMCVRDVSIAVLLPLLTLWFSVLNSRALNLPQQFFEN